MALRPLYGHTALRARLASSWLDGRLPGSLLFQGPPSVGKQRLALWLGQLQLCEVARPQRLTEPCGACQGCRYALRGLHPDLHWFFPRPRLKDSDPTPEDVVADLAEATAERMEAEGLWAGAPGADGLYVATIRALVHQASLRPAMARSTAFVVGNAERMVSQEGADQAANAFLKLLEEPPPTTTLILTTSEPGALLPTIRSRVVTVRVASLPADDVATFFEDSVVHRRFGTMTRGDAIARAAGAPGRLLEGETGAAAYASARRLLDAALQPSSPSGAAERAKVAARLGVSGARGAFTDSLDALTLLLHARTRALVLAQQPVDARRTASAMSHVEQAKLRARGNVSPQLLGSGLMRSLHAALVG